MLERMPALSRVELPRPPGHWTLLRQSCQHNQLGLKRLHQLQNQLPWYRPTTSREQSRLLSQPRESSYSRALGRREHLDESLLESPASFRSPVTFSKPSKSTNCHIPAKPAPQ